MKKSVFIFFLLMSSVRLIAQNAWTIYNSSNSLLPDNTVRSLAIDHNNTKWIGTDYGLVAWHDTTWQVYQTTNSDLPDNSIRAIYVDKQNNKWIGTFNGGVAKFDDSTWTIYDMTNSGLPDNYVKGIGVDSSGRKWFCTISGLAVFDDTSWTIYNMFNSIFMSNNVSCIHIDEQDAKSIGSYNGGLVTVSDTTWTVYTIQNSGIQDNTILSIDKDTLGNTWLGMPTGGLMALVPGGIWLWYHTGNGNIQSNSINAVKVAPDQRIWLGSQDAGLINKTGINFTSYNVSNSGIPEDFVHAVLLDSGIVWLGTATQGLVRFDESQLTAAEEHLVEAKPFVYPNPCKGNNLFIQSPENILKEITFYDLAGKSQPVMVSGTGRSIVTADISRLPAGIYFVKTTLADNSFYFQKLLKIK
jgi:ligand-binding sensor domain-containing protein